MSKGTAFLMYHELQVPGGELCDDEPGYALYAVAEKDFIDQLATLKRDSWNGWSVSEALQSTENPNGEDFRGVCFTFDDGCATDLSIAAPLLKEKGFNATFYVTVNHLGKKGYLTSAELRQLSDLGFEIGSHSMTHRHLNDLEADEIKFEIVESKKRLEEIIGRTVTHFSCPGGRVNGLVKRVAQDAGYYSVATSRIGLNASNNDRFELTRIAVKRGMTTRQLESICRGEGLFRSQAQETVLRTAKRVLGNSMYERLRAAVLR